MASESIASINGGKDVERNVALKFMKKKDQFTRDKDLRSFLKDLEKYVVGVYNAYTQDDKIYRDAIANPCVETSISRTYSLNSTPSIFARFHALSSYFGDFKDYPFLLVMPSADSDLKTIIR
jgi:hypothetical protein